MSEHEDQYSSCVETENIGEGSEIETEGSHRNRTDPTQSHQIEHENSCSFLCDDIRIKLYKAALTGDWKFFESLFTNPPITMKMNNQEETALHIAAAAKHICFVENLVKHASQSDLEARTKDGSTALAYAAISGIVRIAKGMVDKNSTLPNLCDREERTPVLVAVIYKKRDMASFLYHKTNFQALNSSQKIELFVATIEMEYYDIALDILQTNQELAKERTRSNDTALHVLARQKFTIGSSGELSFWKRYINSCLGCMYNKALMQTLAYQIVERLWKYLVQNLTEHELSEFIKTPSRLLHDAARVGNSKFLIILIRLYPDLLWKTDDEQKSIFHVAVENRQGSVFSLIYEIGGLKDFIANYFDTKKKSNMLHLAGRLVAPYLLNEVSGAALQMQRELSWFKEVEKIVVPSHHRMRMELSEVRTEPVESLTPRELFTKEHMQLLKYGEVWMRNTANSCMLVATLIATVVFAAAFTIPGGNHDTQGIPIFRDKQVFTVFVVSDVAALVLSTTSIVTFLSILTSRYAEDDFLMALPMNLLIGLMTLFASIACMMVAFTVSFFIVYDKSNAKIIPFSIAVIAIIPVGVFCFLHGKLVADMLQFSFRSNFSFSRCRRRLF